MVPWYYLIVLFGVGSIVGFVICALLSMSRVADADADAAVWRKKYFNLYQKFKGVMSASRVN